MQKEELYKLYSEIVRPIYAEIEARGNTLPVELLFETHSAFDHLSRIYTDNTDEDKCIEKTISHLKRGALDAFKLKLKYFYTDLKKFEKVKIDFTLIDNGDFFRNFSRLKTDIRQSAKKARLDEKNVSGKIDIKEAFDEWLKVSNLIDKMEEECFNSPKISWAKNKTFRIWSVQTIVAFVIGIITGLVGNFLWLKICSLLSR